MTVLIPGEIGRLTSESSASENDFLVIYDGGSIFKIDANNLRRTALSTSDVILVEEPSDLSGDLRSDAVYRVSGTIDMGSQQIVVPEGGLSISGPNGGRDVAVLLSSEENYTMFVSPDGGYSGNVVMDNMSVQVDGSGSQVFDLDNQGNSGAFECTVVNFNFCTSLGSLSEYRQMLMSNVGFIFIQDGFTFNEAWTGIAVTTTILLASSPFTLFSAGSNFTVGNVRSDINANLISSSGVIFDFSESNVLTDGGFSLTNVRTTADNPIPNISGSSVRSRFKDCLGFRNTYVGGQWMITAESVTSIPAANTLVQIAGTTSYSDLQWFSGDNSNEFVYESEQMIECEVKCVLSLSGGSNDQMNVVIRQYDDSSSTYIDLSSSGPVTLNSGGRAEGVATFAYASLNEGDRIEVWIENLTDDSDVTALNGGLVAITERPS